MPIYLSNKTLISLMKRHKVTIRDLSMKTGFTMKRIREVRNSGLSECNAARDWIQAITNVDPGYLTNEFKLSKGK